ncbi:thermonuclease family protein [Prosthecomicrobium sp. N25]|uniref:thermonuclease family protein n=1 Tax=Prosthecomicrobium sp. N25 TaxID=3129254 RepID=UPI00307862AA
MRSPTSRFARLAQALVLVALAAGAWGLKEHLIPPERVAGRARVVDGDSLEIDGRRLRLKGIDAPELNQVCRRADAPYPCGRAARQRLADIVGTGALDCAGAEDDRYGRLLVRCRAGAEDVGARLVREGWALDWGGYGREENEARRARRGLWSGEFESPDLWRRAHRRGES